MSSNTIQCPKCGTSIQVDTEVQKKLEADIKQQYESELEAERKELEKQREKMENYKANEKKLFEKKTPRTNRKRA